MQPSVHAVSVGEKRDGEKRELMGWLSGGKNIEIMLAIIVQTQPNVDSFNVELRVNHCGWVLNFLS